MALFSLAFSLNTQQSLSTQWHCIASIENWCHFMHNQLTATMLMTATTMLPFQLQMHQTRYSARFCWSPLNLSPSLILWLLCKEYDAVFAFFSLAKFKQTALVTWATDIICLFFFVCVPNLLNGWRIRGESFGWAVHISVREPFSTLNKLSARNTLTLSHTQNQHLFRNLYS